MNTKITSIIEFSQNETASVSGAFSPWVALIMITHTLNIAGTIYDLTRGSSMTSNAAANALISSAFTYMSTAVISPEHAAKAASGALMGKFCSQVSAGLIGIMRGK
jgi:hypothetical protein